MLSSKSLKVTHVLDNADAAVVTTTSGAVIVSGNFTSDAGGSLLILASGSIWSSTGGLKAVKLQIDSVDKATKNFFINNAGEHLTFGTLITVETGIAAGSRTIRWITGDAVTNTDANDKYDLVVMELPF